MSKEEAEKLIYEGNQAFKHKDAFTGIEKYRQGIKIYKKLKDFERVLDLLRIVSQQCISNEQLIFAEEFANNLYKLAKDHDQIFYLGSANYILGYLLLKKGEKNVLEDALNKIQDAAINFERVEDFAGAGMCFNKIGTIYHSRLNKIENACLFYRAAIENYNKAIIKIHPLRTSFWNKPELLIQKIVELRDIINDLMPNLSNSELKDNIMKDLKSFQYNFDFSWKKGVTLLDYNNTNEETREIMDLKENWKINKKVLEEKLREIIKSTKDERYEYDFDFKKETNIKLEAVKTLISEYKQKEFQLENLSRDHKLLKVDKETFQKSKEKYIDEYKPEKLASKVENKGIEKRYKRERPIIEKLIQEMKFSDAVLKLNGIRDVAKRYNLSEINSWANKKLDLCDKLEKTENLKKKFSLVEKLMQEMKFSDAIRDLNDIKKKAERNHLGKILKWAERNLTLCYKPIIKKTILELGIKFARLQIAEISEVCGSDDVQLIVDIVKDMIENKEIYAQYFSSTKSVAFDQQANIDEIDKLMSTYKDWEDKKVGKK